MTIASGQLARGHGTHSHQSSNAAAFVITSLGVYFSQFNRTGLGVFTHPRPSAPLSECLSFRQVYGLVGARFSALSQYPVPPPAGLAWVIRDDCKLKLIPPDPRIVSLGTPSIAIAAAPKASGRTAYPA